MALDYHEFAVLVVDDEPDILSSFRYNYGEDFDVLTAESGPRGLELLAEHDIAVIVADQRMPQMSGTEFLERSMHVRPDAIRIILTGFTDVDALVQAVNLSRIYRYVTKPWSSEELRLTLLRAIEAFHLTRENARLVEELRRANERLAVENAYLRESVTMPTEIVGVSGAIHRVLELVARVAPTSSTVLISGETGTGKELVARAIHAASPRRDELFVAVNCASLSEGVLESELFGHRRGAFTGAVGDRKGLFEVADGGTLFLDEVSETTPSLQANLLRVVQEGEIRPVGDNRSYPVDVRIITATNRRLEEEIKANRFREDLYYRLSVFPIHIPPLRERREDIPVLARHLVHQLAAQLRKRVGEPTPEALEQLVRHPFPGNVRELANELERAILLADPGAPITEDLLSEQVQESAAADAPPGVLQARTSDFERQQILAALERAGGVKTKVADELGLSYRGLMKKLRRLGL
ncbi:MAG TPA: sigma-54 dependent transcriptional regulator [Candidatus Binatia bacterium]|nr:sigma-54 dependent transcriptional regulator [Candidatus Binatia bacterium]